MASTAAGVAVGSTMGHGLSNMLFGGGGSQQVAAPTTPQEQSQFVQATNVGGKCDIQAKGEYFIRIRLLHSELTCFFFG